VDEPSLGRDGTVSLARSFLRELLARADHSTSAPNLQWVARKVPLSDALENNCSQIAPCISGEAEAPPQISAGCPKLRPGLSGSVSKLTTYSARTRDRPAPTWSE
jgi:hypothetical protein